MERIVKQRKRQILKNEQEVEKQGKSSLKYLTIQRNPTRNTHTIWENNKIIPWICRQNISKSENTVQANRQKDIQHEVSPICKLCNREPEDREHFILRCPMLETKPSFI